MIYRVYCSTCNKAMKSKMSWNKWIKYMTFDGRSKGYHEIDSSFVAGEPSVCPFGHPLRTERTIIIDSDECNKSSESNNRD